jgi:hypothetical protein
VHASYCHVTCLATAHFSTLSHEWHDFRNKVTGYEIHVLIFSATLFFILNRIHCDIGINVKMSSCKVSVILVRL